MNKINYLLSTCLISLSFCLIGCSSDKGYDENYQSPDILPNMGAPEITAVYDGADIELSTPISSGKPGQNIIIVGKNLNNLELLRFNTVEADLSKTYTVSTKAYVSIPTAFALEHQNQIEYTTDKGTATYPFVVKFPELVVSHLDNEFAAPGDVVKVVGENFDYYGFDEEGNTKADGQTNGKVEADGTYIVTLDLTNPDAPVLSIAEKGPDVWTVIGGFEGSGWSTDIAMTEVEPGVWKSEALALKANDELKVRANADWAVNRGLPEKGLMEGEAKQDGENLVIAADGNYVVTLDLNAGTLAVEVAK